MKHSKTKKALGFVGELGLWGLANLICLALPLALVFFLGTQVLKWSPWRISLYMVLAGVMTSTWGSWATLVWTRSRGLRSVQQFMTTIPGIVAMAAGGGLLYVFPSRWFISAGFIASGIGMIAAAIVLAGGVFTKNQAPSKLQYLFGLLVYPLTTTALGGAVASVWYMFLNRPALTGWKDLLSISTLMITVMAMALVSTVIPAVCSRLSQQAALMLKPR